jgi:hypothetical protein
MSIGTATAAAGMAADRMAEGPTKYWLATLSADTAFDRMVVRRVADRSHG